MKRLIRKILREEIDKSDKHYRILDKISDHVQLPYFDSMVGLTIDDVDDQEYIMKKIYGNDIYIRGNVIYDHRGNNENGNRIYLENSGYWEKREYNDNGKMIYREYSSGYWEKREYDDKGRDIYWESSDGRWVKTEYDDKGNEWVRRGGGVDLEYGRWER
jgi:hypothetical protein